MTNKRVAQRHRRCVISSATVHSTAGLIYCSGREQLRRRVERAKASSILYRQSVGGRSCVLCIVCASQVIVLSNSVYSHSFCVICSYLVRISLYILAVTQDSSLQQYY